MSPSPVDTDRLAGHKSGLVRGEKRDHCRYLVGAAEAAHRDGFGALGKPDLEVVAVFPPVGADRPRGADRTGTDGIDGDPAWSEIERQRFREPDDRGFGGGV